MIVAILVEIDRIVFSPSLSTDIIPPDIWSKTTFMSSRHPKPDIATKTTKATFYNHYYFFKLRIFDKVNSTIYNRVKPP